MRDIKKQRGDTIVEVLLATVVISVVLASAFTLTNRATRLNQTAVERTTVSNLMREQVELIRGARTQGDSAVWQTILDEGAGWTANGSPTFDDCEPSNSNPFWLDPSKTFDDSSMIAPYDNEARMDAHPSDLFGIWAETYYNSADPSNREYIDVYVRACWEGIGGEAEQNSSIVLRLAI